MYLPTTASHASAINLNLKYITHREDGHVGQYKHSVLHVSITNYTGTYFQKESFHIHIPLLVHKYSHCYTYKTLQTRYTGQGQGSMHTHREEGTTRTVGYWWAVGMKRSPDSSLRPRLAASGCCRSCLERHLVGQWLEETQEKELLDATPVKGWRKREGGEGRGGEGRGEERRVGMEKDEGEEGWGESVGTNKRRLQKQGYTLTLFFFFPKSL